MTVKHAIPPKSRFNSPPLRSYSQMSTEELLAFESWSYAMKEADMDHEQLGIDLGIFLEDAT